MKFKSQFSFYKAHKEELKIAYFEKGHSIYQIANTIKKPKNQVYYFIRYFFGRTRTISESRKLVLKRRRIERLKTMDEEFLNRTKEEIRKIEAIMKSKKIERANLVKPIDDEVDGLRKECTRLRNVLKFAGKKA